MSASLTLVTSVHATVTRRRLAYSLPLRLSPLLRHVLATASPRLDGQPNLLPDFIPERCCGNLFSCHSAVRWRVGDGRNKVFFCQDCFERLWEAGFDVQDFVVERYRL